MRPASRYRTGLPATATFRLAPTPIIGISTSVEEVPGVVGDPEVRAT
jgi:hypothetical protein